MAPGIGREPPVLVGTLHAKGHGYTHQCRRAAGNGGMVGKETRQDLTDLPPVASYRRQIILERAGLRVRSKALTQPSQQLGQAFFHVNLAPTGSRGKLGDLVYNLLRIKEIRIDHMVSGSVRCPPLGQQRRQCGERIGSVKQRPVVAQRAHPAKYDFGARSKVYDIPDRPHKCHDPRVHDPAPSRGEHGGFRIDEFGSERAFEAAEVRLTPLSEDPRDAHLLSPFDLAVEVDEAPAEPRCNACTGRRLPHPGEPDQHDVPDARQPPTRPATCARYPSRFRRVSPSESPPNFSRKAPARTNATIASAITPIAGTAVTSLRSATASAG